MLNMSTLLLFFFTSSEHKVSITNLNLILLQQICITSLWNHISHHKFSYGPMTIVNLKLLFTNISVMVIWLCIPALSKEGLGSKMEG